MVFGGVENNIDCKTIGDNYNASSYYDKHGFTIDEGKSKCNQILSQFDIVKPIFSAGMFGILIWQLKPYPFSGAVKLTVDLLSVKIRLIVQRIKKVIEERTTNYEIVSEYDLKVREDGSYYYENENGDIIDA